LQQNRLSIEWGAAALWAFYRLPMHTAMIIDRATIRFANTGKGTVERVDPYNCLRVGSYYVPFVIDREARTLVVMRIYRISR